MFSHRAKKNCTICTRSPVVHKCAVVVWVRTWLWIAYAGKHSISSIYRPQELPVALQAYRLQCNSVGIETFAIQCVLAQVNSRMWDGKPFYIRPPGGNISRSKFYDIDTWPPLWLQCRREYHTISFIASCLAARRLGDSLKQYSSAFKQCVSHQRANTG